MKKLLFIFSLALFTLTGCGQKGPLYLPEPAAETQPSTETTS